MHHDADDSTQSGEDLPRLLGQDIDAGLWRLHVVHSTDVHLAGTVVPLSNESLLVGRIGGGALTASSTLADVLLLQDPRLSRRHARLRVLPGGMLIQVLDESSRNGTWVNGCRVSTTQVESGAVLRLGDTVCVLEYDRREHLDEEEPWPEMPGRSALARRYRALLRDAAETPWPTLILGETGVGKEFAARALHRYGPWRRGSFTAINMAAIAAERGEAELFGWERGAFTGAQYRHQGILATAANGVLLLDEIGDAPRPLQAKLLRFLQDGSFRAVGSSEVRRLDCKVVAATNIQPELAVATGALRADLLHRLSQHRVTLAPLRERRADLLQLADVVTEPSGPSWGLVLGANIVEVLLLHTWPGNLRALQRVLREIRRAMERGEPQQCWLGERFVEEFKRERTRGGRAAVVPVEPWDGVSLGHESASTRPMAAHDGRLGAVVSAAPAPSWPPRRAGRPSRAFLRERLAVHRGVISRVALEAGRDPRQIRRWMRHHHLRADGSEADEERQDET